MFAIGNLAGGDLSLVIGKPGGGAGRRSMENVGLSDGLALEKLGLSLSSLASGGGELAPPPFISSHRSQYICTINTVEAVGPTASRLR